MTQVWRAGNMESHRATAAPAYQMERKAEAKGVLPANVGCKYK
jgi:hypothetical protein